MGSYGLRQAGPVDRGGTERSTAGPTDGDKCPRDGTESDPYYGAPTVVLVFASADSPNKDRDGSLVLGSMMVAAHSVGLASCWINREDAMFATEEGKALMRELQLPDGLAGIGALALGYPDAEPKAAKPRKEDYYRIVK